MLRHKNRVNFDPDTKTKSFLTPHQNQANSHLYTEIKSISISHTEIKSISTTHTSISMPTLKANHFRPVHKYHVNFDHPHRKQVYSEPYTDIESISISHTKIRWFPTTYTKTS